MATTASPSRPPNSTPSTSRMYAKAKSRHANTTAKLAAMETASWHVVEAPDTCRRAPTADVFARTAETEWMATVMDMSAAKPMSA